MFEKRTVDQGISVTFPEVSLYVTVNDFETSTLKGFISECDKVLKTNQKFLPILIDSYGDKFTLCWE